MEDGFRANVQLSIVSVRLDPVDVFDADDRDARSTLDHQPRQELGLERRSFAARRRAARLSGQIEQALSKQRQSRLFDALLGPLERLEKARVLVWLQEIVGGVTIESVARVGLVGSHEDDDRPLLLREALQQLKPRRS